jgi:hypothetical protein
MMSQTAKRWWRYNISGDLKFFVNQLLLVSHREKSFSKIHSFQLHRSEYIFYGKTIHTKIKLQNSLSVFKFQEFVQLPNISCTHFRRNVRFTQGMSSAYTDVILHQEFPINFSRKIFQIRNLRIKSKLMLLRPKLNYIQAFSSNLAENTVRLEYTKKQMS